MNALSIAEKKALELMQKDNFRGISKDNVMQLMSILEPYIPEFSEESIKPYMLFAEEVKSLGEIEFIVISIS